MGAGRVGAVLGAALRRAGHDIVAVSAVSDLSRLRAEALLPGVPVLDARAAAATADLVLLAVPDDVLPGLVAGMVEAGAIHAGQFVAHPSGRYGIDVLEPAAQAGALPLAIHPVMTFTGTSVDLARLADCPFGVTAPDAVRPVAEALVVEMGGEPIWVPEEARGLYHAGIAFGANFLMTVVLESLDLLRSAVYGFGAAMGFSLVLVLFAAQRERIAVADVPEPFQGSAIALVTAGLMSLAFMGFAGLVSN